MNDANATAAVAATAASLSVAVIWHLTVHLFFFSSSICHFAMFAVYFDANCYWDEVTRIKMKPERDRENNGEKKS